ncbi:hypothetical protein HPB49_003091 [Dermacentor silvarum]|uniref:Uncharacterized protein n=1 Tax=Dermacentor silvarum TaxID=543639 RepID=A0ACB8DMP5_DERSI|nr:hypothetical protein HPB49_003091 [Dermacentor silvarum]
MSQTEAVYRHSCQIACLGGGALMRHACAGTPSAVGIRLSSNKSRSTPLPPPCHQCLCGRGGCRCSALCPSLISVPKALGARTLYGGNQSSSRGALAAPLPLNVLRYQCNICSYSTVYKQALNRHQRVHTGERPYQCELCPRTFAQKCNMKLHLRRHGACPYRCRFCNRIFRYGEQLHEHLQQEHAASF